LAGRQLGQARDVRTARPAAEFGGNGDPIDSAGFGQDAAGFVRLVRLAQ
jgi:hypothetical protein